MNKLVVGLVKFNIEQGGFRATKMQQRLATTKWGKVLQVLQSFFLFLLAFLSYFSLSFIHFYSKLLCVLVFVVAWQFTLSLHLTLIQLDHTVLTASDGV
jgi:hypothetical protein